MARRGHAGKLLVAAASAALAATTGWPRVSSFVGSGISGRHMATGRAASTEAAVELEMPKRPKNAYMLWLLDNRPRIAQTVSGSKVSEVAKKAGEEWKALDESAKDKYKKMADEAKARYNDERARFEAAGGVVTNRRSSSKATKKKKEARDPNKPKRPTGGAFGVFLKENRGRISSAVPGSSVTAVSKLAGEEWRKMSESSKQPYVTTYNELKAQYDEDMKVYMSAQQSGRGAPEM